MVFAPLFRSTILKTGACKAAPGVRGVSLERTEGRKIV